MANYTSEKRYSLQQMLLDIHMRQKETRSLCLILCKYQLQVVHDLGVRHKTLQLKEEETKTLYDIGIDKALLNTASVV